MYQFNHPFNFYLFDDLQDDAEDKKKEGKMTTKKILVANKIRVQGKFAQLVVHVKSGISDADHVVVIAGRTPDAGKSSAYNDDSIPDGFRMKLHEIQSSYKKF